MHRAVQRFDSPDALKQRFDVVTRLLKQAAVQ